MITIKFPTRGRPEKFFSTLDQYIIQAGRLKEIRFVITLDIDDASMNTPAVLDRLDKLKKSVNLCYDLGISTGKISAINRDMEKYIDQTDIILLASDDMIPILKRYDEAIEFEMRRHYKDFDGCLWFNDGFTGNRINTLCILGKTYYKRFGYIYNPEYQSLWADNEYTLVAQDLNKISYYPQVIIKHEHPNFIRTIERDALYKLSDGHMDSDELIFRKRMAKNFKD